MGYRLVSTKLRSVYSKRRTALLVVLFVTVAITGCIHFGEPQSHPATPYEPEVQQRVESRDVPETHPNATLQDTETVEYWVVAYTNHERMESGLEPLVWSSRLAQIADYRSYDMYNRSYYGHYGPNGSGFTKWLKKFRFNSWSQSSENIHSLNYDKKEIGPDGETITYRQPQKLAQALVRGWMISGEHRWAMMHGDYSVIGVGVYGQPNGNVKATQLFSDREKFDRAVNANETDMFEVPIAEEDPMEDESDVENYPGRLGPNTPNDE